MSLQWNSITMAVSYLNSIYFHRRALVESTNSDLVIFYDASKQTYGFTACMVQNNISNLVFAKAKGAPMKRKTLLTLEPLSVYLTLNCPFWKIIKYLH